MERIRELASQWHRSDEGRAWHREHGKAAYSKRVPLDRTCDQCGKSFASMGRRQADRFCCGYCKHRWRLESGVDDETRTCEFCSTEFKVNKYLRTRFCSRACGGKSRSSKSKG